MAGFDTEDALRSAPLGYRAEIMQPEVASYNGFHFPPTLHSQITVVPEYNESGTSLKYLTVAISVEFIATDPAAGIDEYSENDEEAKAAGMNTFMSSLIKRLSYPCQELKFSARGFGDFEINTSGGIKDVDFGPKPQVIEWEPLGGSQAARVQWLCTTRIPHDLTNAAAGKLISFEYGVQWGIDSAGFMFRSIEGQAEVPLTRAALPGNQHSSHIFPFPLKEFKDIQDKILKAWPQPNDARRQFFWRWDKSHKKFTFKIEDVEIRSDSPYLPGIVDIDLTQNVTSSMEDGAFLKWRIVYTGRIEVAAGNQFTKKIGVSDSKKIAWIWLGKILQEKRKLFEETVKSNAATKPQPGNDGRGVLGTVYDYLKDFSGGDNLGTLIYPVYVSITDSMYSNQIQFTIGYVGMVTTDLLSQSLGLFEPVTHDQLNPSAWVKYLEDTDTYKNSEGMWVPGKQEMIVDLCHTVTSSPGDKPTEVKKKAKKKDNDPIFYVSSPEKGKDWKWYENDFIFYDESMNVIGKKLHDQPTTTTETFPTTNPKTPLDGNVNAQGITTSPGETDNVPDDVVEQYPSFSAGNPDPENMLKVYAPTQRTIYVQMHGYAERFGGKINAPKLVGVGNGIAIDPATGQAFIQDNSLGGALAHKFDQDQITRGVKQTGLKDSKGKPVTLFWCKWSKMYVLDRVPLDGKVVTTGIPTRFQTNIK
jgi:hypothetical protein